ncbi:recombinase family protein [Streptomyces sp. NPDC002104]
MQRAPVLTTEDQQNDVEANGLATFLADVIVPDDLSGLEPYIGYIRVSTWKEEKISPQLQKVAIEEWARRTKRRIARWIYDLDQTGRTFKRKVMRAIEAVERGDAAGIAVWKYSRFGRNRNGIAVNLKRVEDVGGQLESATEQIDARTALGKFQRGILFEFAAYESDRAGEQWKETHRLRRDAGLPATGRARWGYIWHPRRVLLPNGSWTTQKEWYEIDPEIGPIVAHLFRQYLSGHGFADLTGWLNAEGYRTTRNTLWSAETLKRYMDSGFAAGLLRFHDENCMCKTTNGGCPRHYLAEGAHEECISIDLWQQYLDKRAEVRTKHPRQRQGLYTLTGTTCCGLCRGGTSINPKNTTINGERVYIPGHAYKCNSRGRTGSTVHSCPGLFIQRDKVEKEVKKWLATKAAPAIDLMPPTEQEQRDTKADEARRSAQRVKLQAEHTKLEEALKRLAMDNALNPDKYPEGVYEGARDQFVAERDAVTASISKLVPSEQTGPGIETFRPIMVGLLDEWDTLLTIERNAIIRQLVRRVVLTSSGVGAAAVTVTVHPVWEADPWAPKEGEGQSGQVFGKHNGRIPELVDAG